MKKHRLTNVTIGGDFVIGDHVVINNGVVVRNGNVVQSNVPEDFHLTISVDKTNNVNVEMHQNNGNRTVDLTINTTKVEGNVEAGRDVTIQGPVGGYVQAGRDVESVRGDVKQFVSANRDVKVRGSIGGYVNGLRDVEIEGDVKGKVSAGRDLEVNN
jgi:cytoskeletal protein CcmA (bactofilin family)